MLQSLHMPTIRELEDLIIDGIYLDLIGGKLDQKYQQLEVEYVLGRDVEEAYKLVAKVGATEITTPAMADGFQRKAKRQQLAHQNNAMRRARLL